MDNFAKMAVFGLKLSNSGGPQCVDDITLCWGICFVRSIPTDRPKIFLLAFLFLQGICIVQLMQKWQNFPGNKFTEQKCGHEHRGIAFLV